jgi:hypothetical protein
MCNSQPHKRRISFEMGLPIEKAQKQRTMSVSFSQSVLVCEIRCIHNMTDKEIQAVWYGANDYAAMKADCQSTSAMIMAKEALDLNTHCARGLERILHGSMQRRRKNRSEALFAVLDEQEAQWTNRENDVAFLAEIYGDCSAPCRAIAYRTAQLDQLDAFASYGISRQPSLSRPLPPKQSVIVRGLANLPRLEKPRTSTAA